MANETTTTSWTSQILSESLAEVALPAAGHPKLVMTGLVNVDSIDGEASGTKAYAKLTDIGQASTATEGTDLSTNTELARDTQLTLSPTEAAAIMSQITNQAVRRKVPGLPSNAVQALFEGGDVAQIVNAVAEDAGRLARACLETAEDNLCNLMSGFSNTVGSTGVDITLAVAVEAIYTAKTLEMPHEDLVFALCPNQVYELQLEAGVTSGGIAGALWNTQADGSFINANLEAGGVMGNGFRGSFMGIPVYEIGHSLRTTMNAGADVAGTLQLRGRGTPDGGQVGAMVLVEGAPLFFTFEYSAAARAVELVCIYEHATAEVNDSFGVTIVSDAP